MPDLESDERLGVGIPCHTVFLAVARVLAAYHVECVIGSIDRKTLFFSSLMARGSRAVGGSITTNAITWNRWVTTMSL